MRTALPVDDATILKQRRFLLKVIQAIPINLPLRAKHNIITLLPFSCSVTDLLFSHFITVIPLKSFSEE
jgi:hypothetical protein